MWYNPFTRIIFNPFFVYYKALYSRQKGGVIRWYYELNVLLNLGLSRDSLWWHLSCPKWQYPLFLYRRFFRSGVCAANVAVEGQHKRGKKRTIFKRRVRLESTFTRLPVVPKSVEEIDGLFMSNEDQIKQNLVPIEVIWSFVFWFHVNCLWFQWWKYFGWKRVRFIINIYIHTSPSSISSKGYYRCTLFSQCKIFSEYGILT